MNNKIMILQGFNKVETQDFIYTIYLYHIYYIYLLAYFSR